MNRPTFLQGALAGLSASVVGAGGFWTLSLVIGTDPALRLVVAALSLAYAVYLLKQCAGRTGRAVTVAVWLVGAAGLWFAAPSLLTYVIAHVLFVWLIRALKFYASLLTALADLGLCAVSVAAATAAALHTGSVLLSLWCFFLIQALWIAIPPTLQSAARPTLAPPTADDRFQHAYTVAEAAVRKLAALN